ISATAAGLGPDGQAYGRLMQPIVSDWYDLEHSVLGPPALPRHPIKLARFGWNALRSAETVARRTFSTEAARALFRGIAAQVMLPVRPAVASGFALVVAAMAHVAGWVMPRGGAQSVSNALAAHLRALGGEILTGAPVTSIDALPPARAVLCDLSPK